MNVETHNTTDVDDFLRPSSNEMLQFPNALAKFLFRFFQWIYSKVLSLMFSGAPRRIPTTKSSLLMESASSLAGRIRSQKVTSVEVVGAYVDRIKEVNEVLNCVVEERFEEALGEARRADEVIRSGAQTAEELRKRAPFLGVPFTAPEPLGPRGAWAEAAALLTEGGGIPLACTNVSEGCVARETSHPAFGRTRNPYDTNRSAGGPFGGEACLVAASGSPLGVAPSPALPCAFNGVFGHSPTAGSCPRDVGPVSRSSADLLPALLLLAPNLSGELRLQEPVNVKRLKYYFAEEMPGIPLATPPDEEIREAIKKAANHMRNFHGASVERLDLKRITKAFPASKVELTEVRHRKPGFGKNEKVNLGKELVKTLFGKSRHSLGFLLALLGERRKGSVGIFREERAKAEAIRLFANLEELLGPDGVFICPTQPAAAFRHAESFFKTFDFCYADIFEDLGLPATYCPAGLDRQGLPLGFQVVAAKNQDRLTLAVAQEMEVLFGGWKPPPTHGNFTLRNTVFRNSNDEKVKTL